ncbi:MAG TPA: Cu(I)-responsive transcriptional regulator [Alphaproteobacteria bacterium]|nr:Cu(I)-responsive transcriptional regulator [Alphaproteobacteria bacterium]
MNIGAVAKETGVSSKTIRFYESVGLIPRARRSSGGYRLYDQADVARLGFIHRARRLGFSVEEVSALLALWQDRSRASSEVKHLAIRHIAALDDRIAQLQAIRRMLSRLVDACRGDARAECPILEGLAGAPH